MPPLSRRWRACARGLRLSHEAFGVEQVEALLLRLNERQQLMREVVMLREETRDRHRARNFLGNTKVMEDVFQVIERAARSSATVLVNGESGTGKELVARSLHEQSERAEGPFKVNCAALTETLLAGNYSATKKAFTGADAQRIGRFELADGGTILLDEIRNFCGIAGKTPTGFGRAQFERVGGEQTIQVDVRVVATTNRDLPEESPPGNSAKTSIIASMSSPWKCRRCANAATMCQLILQHYLEHFGQEMGCKPSFTDDGLALLCAYRWPGNVRELVNVVERLVCSAATSPSTRSAVRRCLPELKREGALPADIPAATDGAKSPLQSLEELERSHIEKALAQCKGSVQPAPTSWASPRVLGTKLKKWAWSKLAKRFRKNLSSDLRDSRRWFIGSSR